MCRFFELLNIHMYICVLVTCNWFCSLHLLPYNSIKCKAGCNCYGVHNTFYTPVALYYDYHVCCVLCEHV